MARKISAEQFIEICKAYHNKYRSKYGLLPYDYTKTFLDFTKEQLDSMENERVRENLMLGYNADGSIPAEFDSEGLDEEGGMEEDEPIDNKDDEIEEHLEEENDDTSSVIVEMVKSGRIDSEALKELIDSGELSEEEIDALKTEGLYPEETAEDIQAADDSEY